MVKAEHCLKPSTCCSTQKSFLPETAKQRKPAFFSLESPQKASVKLHGCNFLPEGVRGNISESGLIFLLSGIQRQKNAMD
jgi:hypothetical protein